MREATIYGQDQILRCRVCRGKETVHPESPFRQEGQVLDDRIPKDRIVFCTLKGHVQVWTERPTTVSKPVKLVLHERTVRVDRDKWRYTIAPGRSKRVVLWPEHWGAIRCGSRGQAAYVLQLLEAGHWKDVPDDLVV